ncbi:MAG: DNA methyltransferase [Desulfurococcaceae archaeon]
MWRALSYYLLSGLNEEASRDEVRALLGLSDPGAKLTCYSGLCIAEHESAGLALASARLVLRRAAFVKEAGLASKVLALDDPWDRELHDVDAQDATWIEVSNVRSSAPEGLVTKLARQLESKLGLPTTYRPGRPLRAIVTGEAAVIGRRLIEGRLKFGAKAFDTSVSLPWELATFMLNIAGVREGDVILDPFVGTGTILLVAWAFGAVGLGADISERMIEGFALNMGQVGLPGVAVLGDSTTLSYAGASKIVTNPPYGKALSAIDEEKIYEGFLARASEGLRRGGTVVFVAPHWLDFKVDDIAARECFVVKGKYYFYVNSGLTRVIYWVERP